MSETWIPEELDYLDWALRHGARTQKSHTTQEGPLPP